VEYQDIMLRRLYLKKDKVRWKRNANGHASQARARWVMLLIVALVSCKEKPGSLETAKTVDTTAQRTVATIDVIQGRPTKSFLILVNVLDSLGYLSDTSRVKRVKNYKELLTSDIVLFDEFPFYKVDKQNTKVLWWNSISREKSEYLDVGVFAQASEVWAYFYGKREDDGMTVDGVIEQWNFPDRPSGQLAMEKLTSYYPLPYFNTQPYYFVEGSHLFIFHTRASAFSYRQEDFFEMFKEISSRSTGKPWR